MSVDYVSVYQLKMQQPFDQTLYICNQPNFTYNTYVFSKIDGNNIWIESRLVKILQYVIHHITGVTESSGYPSL